MKDFKKRLLSLAGGAGLAGFTLIELVLVVIILAILAAVALPKFINLKTKAIENSEEVIMGALNMAIKNKYLQNLASGTDETSAWPCQDTTNPFTLLTQPPPYQDYTGVGWAAGTQDNYHWRTNRISDAWVFACPHYDGNQTGYANDGTKGRFYAYAFIEGGYNLKQGTFAKLYDYSH